MCEKLPAYWRKLLVLDYLFSESLWQQSFFRLMPVPAPAVILPLADSNENPKEVGDAHPERERVVETTP